LPREKLAELPEAEFEARVAEAGKQAVAAVGRTPPERQAEKAARRQSSPRMRVTQRDKRRASAPFLAG
jgi:hypothetical protein